MHKRQCPEKGSDRPEKLQAGQGAIGGWTGCRKGSPRRQEPAESGKGYIIRLHETAGQAGEARLSFADEPRKIEGVDLLERKKPRRLSRRGSVCRMAYGAYEVISLHVT